MDTSVGVFSQREVIFSARQQSYSQDYLSSEAREKFYYVFTL